MARTYYLKSKKLRSSFSRTINPLLSKLAKKLNLSVGPQVIVFSGHANALRDAEIFGKFMNNSDHPTDVHFLTMDGEKQAIVIANISDQIKINFVQEDSNFLACQIVV